MAVEKRCKGGNVKKALFNQLVALTCHPRDQRRVTVILSKLRVSDVFNKILLTNDSGSRTAESSLSDFWDAAL